MKGIKIARIRKDLNQSELAELIGVSLNTVSSWETGKFNPTTENLVKLANVLDVSVDELISE